MRVAELNVYPLKSTRGRPAAEATLLWWGLADDRRWMVVDQQGTALTARKFPPLLTVTAVPSGEGRLRLSGPHAPPIEVAAGEWAEAVRVRLWNSEVTALRPSDAADAWLGELLGRDARLVWLDDPARRPVNPAYGRPGDHVSFADAFPMLVTSAASLRLLNEWIAEEALRRGEPAPDPLPMSRFRPNLVVEDAEPFAEDSWRRLRVGAVQFRAAKLCDRCVLTTIDPDTLVKGREPLRTLARHRRWEGKVWFGVNLIPDAVGTLRVGDPVTVIES